MATKDRTSLKNDFANGKYATGEKFADLIDSMKVVQLPVVDPQALGTSLSFIDSISQDADGKITATKKTLDLANAHELNPFKGWYKTGDTLPTDGFDGAYLYLKDTSELTGLTTIYRWNGTTYTDTGTVVDTSNVQTFGSGQQVNTVKIKDESGEEIQETADVLSAEAGKRLSDKVVTEKVNYPVDKNSYTEVGFYRPTNGSYSDSTSYVNTGFVRIDNVRNLTLTVNSRSSSCAPVTFWDASKGFISGVTPSSTNGVQTFNVIVPSNAKYAIFSHHATAAYFDDFSLLSYLYVNSVIYQDHCYLSLNGDDDNDGLDSEHPVQTVGRAKSLIGDDGTLFIMEGEYDNYDFDFSSFAKVIGVGSVVFSKYQAKITSASLASGYTRVYEYQDQSVIIPDNMYHIWQHDIPDTSTLISDADRHPLQKNKTHRLPSTRLYKAESIAEIESTTNKQMFYYDSTTRTTYFSIVEGSNLGDNPVVIPVNNTKYYSAKSKKKVYIENISIKYCGFKTKNLYGEIVNMSVGMNYGAGAFMFDDTTDLVVRGCEGYGAYTPTAGDGFNTTGNAQFGLARIYMFDCWGHDNADDGESCHQYCLVIQRGGLFEYNGSGCTPAVGGHGEYYNVTCRYNGGWDWVSDNGGSGFSAQGVNDTIGATVMKCYNCVSVGNTTNYRTTNPLNQPASACYGCVSIDPSVYDFREINHYGSVIVHNENS